jgi:hypothetical protein
MLFFAHIFRILGFLSLLAGVLLGCSLMIAGDEITDGAPIAEQIFFTSLYFLIGFILFIPANRFIKRRREEATAAEKKRRAALTPRQRLVEDKAKLEREIDDFQRGLDYAKEKLVKAQTEGDGDTAKDAQRDINFLERRIRETRQKINKIEVQLLKLRD